MLPVPGLSPSAMAPSWSQADIGTAEIAAPDIRRSGKGSQATRFQMRGAQK